MPCHPKHKAAVKGKAGAVNPYAVTKARAKKKRA